MKRFKLISSWPVFSLVAVSSRTLEPKWEHVCGETAVIAYTIDDNVIPSGMDLMKPSPLGGMICLQCCTLTCAHVREYVSF